MGLNHVCMMPECQTSAGCQCGRVGRVTFEYPTGAAPQVPTPLFHGVAIVNGQEVGLLMEILAELRAIKSLLQRTE